MRERLTDLNGQLATVERTDKPIEFVHEWLPFEFDDLPVSKEPVDAGPAQLWIFQREF